MLHMPAGQKLILADLKSNSFTLVSMVVMLVASLALFCVKYVSCINILMLMVFTAAEGFCLSAMSVSEERQATGMLQIHVYLLASVIVTLFTSQLTVRDTAVQGHKYRLLSMSWAGFIGFLVAMSAAILAHVFVPDGSWITDDPNTGARSTGGLVVCLILALMLNTWFSYDADIIAHKLAVDEYIQAVVLFYTDLMLFLGFILLLCFMCCFGGDSGMAEGGGDMGGGGGGAEMVSHGPAGPEAGAAGPASSKV